MNKIKNQFSLRNVIGGLAILVLLSVGCGDKKDDENIGGPLQGGLILLIRPSVLRTGAPFSVESMLRFQVP